MKILVWNINGLVEGATHRNIVLQHGGLQGFFEHHQADVICIQESKLTEDKISKEIACVEGYESFWTCSEKKKGYSGVITWVAKEYSPKHAAVDILDDGTEDFEKEGRIVLTDLEAFLLINVYVPNAGSEERLRIKNRFMKCLRFKLNMFLKENRSIVLVGDLNVVLSNDDLHQNYKVEDLYTEEERDGLRDLLVDHVDTWRWLHPREKNTFSYFSERHNNREFNKVLPTSQKGLQGGYALGHEIGLCFDIKRSDAEGRFL